MAFLDTARPLLQRLCYCVVGPSRPRPLTRYGPPLRPPRTLAGPSPIPQP